MLAKRLFAALEGHRHLAPAAKYLDPYWAAGIQRLTQSVGRDGRAIDAEDDVAVANRIPR